MSKREIHLQHQVAFDKAAPLVATFRNGPPAPTKDNKMYLEVYEHPSKKQRIVISNTEKVAYQAANFGYQSSSNDSASYAVGVFDKNTRELRICNVDQIYVMQQSVKGAQTQTEAGNEASKSYMDKRRDLVEVFGSKKSKRIAKNREENMVDLQNISGASSVSQTLKQKITKASQDEKARDAGFSTESAALASTRNAILPPCNIDAASPDKVYELTRFLDSEVLESLAIKAQEVVDALEFTRVTDYVKSHKLSPLVAHLLSTLPTPYNLQKMSYLVYYSYLLSFFKTKFPIRKGAAQVSESMDVPLVVVRHVLKLFTEPVQAANGYMSFTQSKTLKDKLTLYMTVVALTLSGFSLDIAQLASDLKKSPMTIGTYCRQLGCVVEKVKADSVAYGANALASKKTSTSRAVLSLPLHFPLPKKGAGPRR